MKRVEPAQETLCRRVPDAAPRGSNGMRKGERPGAELDVDSGECGADPVRAADARRGEGDDLVRAARDFDEAAERPLHVVPDPEKRVRER